LSRFTLSLALSHLGRGEKTEEQSKFVPNTEEYLSQQKERPRWWWYLPSVLLLLVTANQLRLVSTTALSPWWGGGFAMFATTDGWATRHLHVFALRLGIRRELSIPVTLRTEVERVLTLPSDANLQVIAREFADMPTPDEGPLIAIELQVWATHYDPITLAPSGVLLRALTVPLDES
jgi:hypothetical protein